MRSFDQATVASVDLMYAVQPENNLVGVDSQATLTSVVDNLYHTRVSFRKVPIEVLPPSTHQSPTNSKPTVVVAVVGGFFLIVALGLYNCPSCTTPCLQSPDAERGKRKIHPRAMSPRRLSPVAENSTTAPSPLMHLSLLEPNTSSASAPEYSRFDPAPSGRAHLFTNIQHDFPSTCI